MKNIKKMFAMIIAITLVLTFAANATPIYQAPHFHEWNYTSEGDMTTFKCEDCGLHMVVNMHNLQCSHEFEEYTNEEFHGASCVHCGYAIGYLHVWRDCLFEDGIHTMKCDECGYEEAHLAETHYDEEGHHYKCLCCETYQVDYHVPNLNMVKYKSNEYFHLCECTHCGYLVSQSHTFEDGECVCGYISAGEDEDIPEVEEDFGEETEVVHGIFLDAYETKYGYAIDVLHEGELLTYAAVSMPYALTEGSFVRVTLDENGAVNGIEHLVDAEIVGDLRNMSEHLYGALYYDYEDAKKRDIIVEEVYTIDEWTRIEFASGDNVKIFEPTIYNLETREMDSIEEGDYVLTYLTDSEDILIIVG